MINYTPAKEKGLGCSLFQRYAEMLSSDEWDMPLPENSMLMLTTQYRMVLTFQILIFYTLICCNCSMKKFVNFHLKSFMKDNSKQTHLCYDIFAHLKDFGQGGLNGLLHFVT